MAHDRVGIVWPEAVQAGHLAELELFVPPGLELDIEPVDSTPPLGDDGITLEHVEGIARVPGIGRAAKRLAQRGAQAVAYGCTSGSYVLGTEGDAAIAAGMRTASGVPSTTTSTAAAAALRELGVQRIAVLSPHVDALNERLRAYLEASGFAVVNMVGLNRRGDIEAVEPDETRDLVAAGVDTPEAEAVFISCTGLRTAAVIEDLEAALKKPVVTANQATLWHVAELAGAPAATLGRGRLFAALAG
ncbi:MAG: aspartate/glutamate racemase family protein [Chloroflexi bacterium]|nr:aspartate/glutamate racemase family protein [Chloroflexota bacterium]